MTAEKPTLRAKPKLRINQPTSKQAKDQEHTNRRPWQVARAVGIFLVGTIGLLASVYQLGGGAPWPTEPIFLPGAPSFGDPFGIPFTVENKSWIFWIKNLEVLCGLEDVETSNKSGVGKLSIQGTGIITSLAPSGSGQLSAGAYICPLRSFFSFKDEHGGIAPIVAARITFISKYDARIPWGSRVTSSDGPFTLVTTTTPQHWIKAIPLQK